MLLMACCGCLIKYEFRALSIVLLANSAFAKLRCGLKIEISIIFWQWLLKWNKILGPHTVSCNFTHFKSWQKKAYRLCVINHSIKWSIAIISLKHTPSQMEGIFHPFIIMKTFITLIWIQMNNAQLNKWCLRQNNLRGL